MVDDTTPRIISEDALEAMLRETLRESGRGDLHVFAYGSLAWRPGFPFQRRWPALVRGYARRLCVRSSHYRGTPEKPGLVFGLDAGGSCAGSVFRAAAAEKEEVARYLFRREMFANVYRPRFVLARPLMGRENGGESGAGGGGRAVRALAFVARREHPQFAPPMPEEEALEIIRACRGVGGCNREYILNTLSHLREMGVSCPTLERLGRRL